jgi:hypothetical protein
VGDLQSLERNRDLYSDFDVLDDIGSKPAAGQQGQKSREEL